MARSIAYATVILVALAGPGCQTERRGQDHPPARRALTAHVPDKSEEPGSQVWPLGQWLDEFGWRNGVVVQYEDRDVHGIEVIRPGPGPYPTEDDAKAALARACRERGLILLEEKRHVYRVKRMRADVR